MCYIELTPLQAMCFLKQVRKLKISLKTKSCLSWNWKLKICFPSFLLCQWFLYIYYELFFEGLTFIFHDYDGKSPSHFIASSTPLTDVSTESDTVYGYISTWQYEKCSNYRVLIYVATDNDRIYMLNLYCFNKIFIIMTCFCYTKVRVFNKLLAIHTLFCVII